MPISSKVSCPIGLNARIAMGRHYMLVTISIIKNKSYSQYSMVRSKNSNLKNLCFWEEPIGLAIMAFVPQF